MPSLQRSSHPGPPDFQIFVVDDHPVFRRGIIQLIDNEPNFKVCGHAVSGPEALAKLRKVEADVISVDISLGDTNGIELTKKIRAEHPEVKIVVVSMFDDTACTVDALRAGASGYVMKGHAADEFMGAVREILDGRLHVSSAIAEELVEQAIEGTGKNTEIGLLSRAEAGALVLIGLGKSVEEISLQLRVGEKTIQKHIFSMQKKLGIGSLEALHDFSTRWIQKT